MDLLPYLQSLFSRAYKQWLLMSESDVHSNQVVLFTQSVGFQSLVAKRVMGINFTETVSNARRLVDSDSQNYSSHVIVYSSVPLDVTMEVVNSERKVVSIFKATAVENLSDTIRFTVLEELPLEHTLVPSLAPHPLFRLLYTRRALKPNLEQFFSYFQQKRNYSIDPESQVALYLNKDTDVSFQFALTEYGKLGEHCISFTLETFKSNIFAFEAIDQLKPLCSAFDITFDENSFLERWCAQNLFEARKYLRRASPNVIQQSFSLPEQTIRQFWNWNYKKSIGQPRILLIENEGLVKSCVKFSESLCTIPLVDFLVIQDDVPSHSRLINVHTISNLRDIGYEEGMKVVSISALSEEQNIARCRINSPLRLVAFSEVIPSELLDKARAMQDSSKSILAPPSRWE